MGIKWLEVGSRVLCTRLWNFGYNSRSIFLHSRSDLHQVFSEECWLLPLQASGSAVKNSDVVVWNYSQWPNHCSRDERSGRRRYAAQLQHAKYNNKFTPNVCCHYHDSCHSSDLHCVCYHCDISLLQNYLILYDNCSRDQENRIKHACASYFLSSGDDKWNVCDSCFQ